MMYRTSLKAGIMTESRGGVVGVIYALLSYAVSRDIVTADASIQFDFSTIDVHL